MRKFLCFFLLALAAGIGLIIGLMSEGGGWGPAIVMMGLALLFTAPVALAIGGIGEPLDEDIRPLRGRRRARTSMPHFKGESPIRRWH